MRDSLVAAGRIFVNPPIAFAETHPLMLAKTALESFVRPFCEFVYPRLCLLCETSLQEQERKVCEACWTQIHAINVQDPLYENMMVRLRSMAHVEGLVTKYLFEKDGILQSLIHELKYGGMRSIGVELGRRLSDDLVPALESVRITGVVPVPLHRRKKRERGYNQSEYICKGIHMVTGLNVFASLLRRVKDTKTQTQLSLDARHDNVHDAFALDTSQVEVVRDGTFLIVDDVITTGATIDACAEALMKHGAKRAVACSVALADRSCLP